MKVVVLGAGIIGVSTAWWLRQEGHEVTVIDRQSGAGQETSFANGCQISVSFSEPWAQPSAPFKVAKWMFQPDAPLLFKVHWDVHQWKWMLSFLNQCLPSRLPHNVRAMVSLSSYSLKTMQEMRQTLDIPYHALTKGILNFYRTQEDFDGSQKSADMMRDFGVNRRIISTDEAIQIEPALAPHRHKIVGADYTSDDETGDIYMFTQGLAQRAEQAGVEFKYNTQITRLNGEAGRVQHVEVIRSDGHYETIDADAFVVAMGSYSTELLRPLGVPCLVYPTKGYSGTFKILKPEDAPDVSLTDSGNKVVFTRIGDRLRIAGTAELAGFSRTLNRVRCEALGQITRELFAGVVDCDQPEYWSGLRPSTPSNVPIVGRTKKYSNLFINTGHGTLGWTMGAGSGRLLADIISSKRPEIDFPVIGY